MSNIRIARRFKALLVVACSLAALAVPAIAAATPTVVSLTFDDAEADQYAVRSMLAQYSMHGTFYVNSNYVGSASALTWEQLSALEADGNEIAGHTLDHVDLTAVSTAEATRQVCDDRQALVSHGLTVTDFAYPYGATSPSVDSIVQACGYSSGRRSWGLCNIGATCSPDTYAETIPPTNIWETRTIQSIRAWNTLADLQSTVTRAEGAGGGWVTLVFHHVCDGCDGASGYSVSPAILSAFLEWLQPRASAGTFVRTVRDVVGDTTPPTTSIACNAASCSSGWYSSPVSVSLSASDTGSGVAAIRYTLDGSDPTPSSPLYGGVPFTVATSTAVKYRAWDLAGNVEATKSQSIQIDSTAPVSSIACNAAPCSNGTYSTPVSVTLSATDSGSGVAAIRYTTDGSDPTTSSTLYDGSPFTVSTSTVVKYRAWDVAGNAEAVKSKSIQIESTPVDTTAPTSTIACNGTTCSTGWYAPPVSVSLSATDSGSGVAEIRYTTDGSDPTTSSPLYTAAFAITTTTVVKYRAWDVAGNVEAANSQSIQVDTFAPTVSITSPSNGATLTGTLKIVAAPADAETGVASVTFYVDGLRLGVASNAPWQVPWNTRKVASGNHVLTAVAADRAGNTQTSAPVTVTVR